MGSERYARHHGQDRIYDATGGFWERGALSDLITLGTGGPTTDSTATLLPASSIIEAVVARVITTIVGATAWALGDPTTNARFLTALATLTAGTTAVGLNHQQGSIATDAAGPVQSVSAKVRVTCTGTPSAGAVRVTVFYRRFVAPTA